ncbi:MAG: Holliday junction resolvase RuvX [Clostridiales bacterium]|nr:Holliday junction resolvase RuvX [Clostridiales bacterium]
MRILAIDYGDARTGVAISDALGMLAGYTTVIHSRDQDQVVESLKALIRDHQVEELVLGLPKNMNDTLGDRAEKSQALARRLREETGLPVTLWDERRTTVDAHRILSENGRHGKKRKNTVDAVAASLILEGFLTYRRIHPLEKGENSGVPGL